MKQKLLLILALLSFGIVYAADFNVPNGEGITISYKKLSDTQVEVTNTYPLYQGAINIPNVITVSGKKYDVVSIGSYAFRQCQITTLNLPSSLTNISEYAFTESTLESILIPNSVQNIGTGAFSYCSSLLTVTLPNNLTSIASATFMNCSNLRTIDIPVTVVSIGTNAFNYCSSLESINLPSTVTTIGDSAFNFCESLGSITIPTSISTIPYYAFSHCSSLQTIAIPKNVTTIGDYAFSECISLVSVDFPETLKSIGNGAFSECVKLTSITIPNSVNTIGAFPFRCCEKLEAFYGKFASEDNRYLIKADGTLFAFAPKGLTSYVIPGGVKSIGEDAFKNYKEITSIIMPNTVLAIGDQAFMDCTALKHIELSSGITSLSYYVFSGCSSLTSVKLPGALTEINDYAFSFCDNLKSLTLPESVTNIGGLVFRGTTNLTSLKVKNPSPISFTNYEDPFDYDSTDFYTSCTLYVPKGSKIEYASCAYWKKFTKIEEYSEANLADGQDYDNTKDQEGVDVTYTRNFKNTYWQGLYVPFDMSYEEWSPYAQVAELAGVHMYDDDNDGTPDRTNIEFATVKDGKILPNVPYVIKAKQTGEVTFECTDKTLTAAPAVNGSISSCTPRWEYVLTGTYVSRPDLIGEGIYSLGSGKFRINNAAIPPYRFYLQMLKRSGGYWGAPGVMDYPMEIEISIDGETVNGISSIFIDEPTDADDEGYYDLNGRKIIEPHNGIYIHKGKLILINK